MALFDYKMLLSVKLEENEKYDFLMSSVKSSIDLSTKNRTQNFIYSFSLTIIFGAVFMKGKIVSKRVRFLNILQKVQVVELHFLPFISLILIIIDRLILLVTLLSI